jgi:hypothetical protein
MNHTLYVYINRLDTFIVDKIKMKFLCFFFLIFHIGIKAESPPSLSFINLIPSIISNGRFVKEKIVNSNLIINPTFPSINFDITFNANGSNCSQDIQILSRDLISKEIWALKSNILLEKFLKFFKLKILFYFSIRCLG